VLKWRGEKRIGEESHAGHNTARPYGSRRGSDLRLQCMQEERPMWLCRSVMHNTRREGRACTNAAKRGNFCMPTDMHMHRRRMQHGIFW
jgi:hypothetical protein